VGLDVEVASRLTLAVVCLPGDERAHERGLSVVDVTGRADDNVLIILDCGPLADCGDPHEPVLPAGVTVGAPGLDIGDMYLRFLGEQGEHIHRLGERLRRDARHAAIVCDTDDVGRLTVTGEYPVAELCGQALEPTVGEVQILRETLFELDTATLVFAPLDCAFEGGPVGTHTLRLRVVDKKPSPGTAPDYSVRLTRTVQPCPSGYPGQFGTANGRHDRGRHSGHVWLVSRLYVPGSQSVRSQSHSTASRNPAP